MTDIEHAKKYAEESISLAISMYNPKAEIIAETACLYGLTFKNERITELEKENAELKLKLGALEGQTPWKDIKDKSELIKENAELKADNAEWEKASDKWKNVYELTNNQLTKAKEIIKKFSEFANLEVEYDPEHPQEHTDLWNKLCAEVEQFLKELEK